jgi:hypothetical protein
LYKKVTGQILTEKQKAYILSIKSSVTMLFMGCLALMQFIKVGCDVEKYVKSDQLLNQFSVLFFTGYLICDCLIGSVDYPKYMKSLSGYTHHIAYIFINCVSLLTGKYPVYMLYMIEELPSVLLSIGSYKKKYRNDDVFGLTFFLTRILYHIILTWWLRKDTMITVISLLVLPLHIYWFYGWCTSTTKRRSTGLVKKETKK